MLTVSQCYRDPRLVPCDPQEPTLHKGPTHLICQRPKNDSKTQRTEKPPSCPEWAQESRGVLPPRVVCNNQCADEKNQFLSPKHDLSLNCFLSHGYLEEGLNFVPKFAFLTSALSWMVKCHVICHGWRGIIHRKEDSLSGIRSLGSVIEISNH